MSFVVDAKEYLYFWYQEPFLHAVRVGSFFKQKKKKNKQDSELLYHTSIIYSACFCDQRELLTEESNSE